MRILKWAGIGLAGLVGLLLLLVGGVYAVGTTNLNRTYDVELATLPIEDDASAIARGYHLANILGCRDCHGNDLGGQVFIDEPPFRVTASNLTSGEGGIGSTFGPADLDRAIRHGVRPSGKGLVVMPSSVYNNMSDEDAANLIAYLRSLEPVDNPLPPTKVRFMGRLLAAGPIDTAYEVRPGRARSVPAPPVGATVEYGEYLTSLSCIHCHGADLRGAQPPDPAAPFAPDLAAAGHWSPELFSRALRTGVLPDGRELDPTVMPWEMTSHMTNDELGAIHAYLATLAN